MPASQTVGSGTPKVRGKIVEYQIHTGAGPDGACLFPVQGEGDGGGKRIRSSSPASSMY